MQPSRDLLRLPGDAAALQSARATVANAVAHSRPPAPLISAAAAPGRLQLSLGAEATNLTLPPTIAEGDEPSEGRPTRRTPEDTRATLKCLNSKPTGLLQDSLDRVMRTSHFSSVDS